MFLSLPGSNFMITSREKSSLKQWLEQPTLLGKGLIENNRLRCYQSLDNQAVMSLNLTILIYMIKIKHKKI
jgi:hypothetical protein